MYIISSSMLHFLPGTSLIEIPDFQSSIRMAGPRMASMQFPPAPEIFFSKCSCSLHCSSYTYTKATLGGEGIKMLL